MGRKLKKLTPELIDEAEGLLKKIEKKGRFKNLKSIFMIADFFIGSLSKKTRAEPDQAGVFDKRYVAKLKSKVFGKGQSESGRSDKPQDATPLPTLEEAQSEALKSDSELLALLAKRDALRAEIKEYSKQIQQHRGKVRQRVKKEGKWRVNEKLFHSPIFRNTKLGVIRKVSSEVLGKIFNKLKGFHRSNDLVKRMGLRLELEETTYTVETVTDLETGKSVRASMDDIGPPNSNLTWSALSNVLKLHVEYVTPMNRIEAMLGSDYFSTANQCRWFSDTAFAFLRCCSSE